jgi:hypothetical protein
MSNDYENDENDDSASRESENQTRRTTQAGHDGQRLHSALVGGTFQTAFWNETERTVTDGTLNEGTL